VEVEYIVSDFEDYAKKLMEEDRQKIILNMINLGYTKGQILDIGYNEDEYNQAEASLATMD
jgi:hypothetical protein